MSKASASSSTVLVVLIATVVACRPLRLPFSKAETTVETATLKCAENTGSDDSAGWQVARLTLKAVHHSGAASHENILSNDPAQARE